MTFDLDLKLICSCSWAQINLELIWSWSGCWSELRSAPDQLQINLELIWAQLQLEISSRSAPGWSGAGSDLRSDLELRLKCSVQTPSHQRAERATQKTCASSSSEEEEEMKSCRARKNNRFYSKMLQNLINKLINVRMKHKEAAELSCLSSLSGLSGSSAVWRRNMNFLLQEPLIISPVNCFPPDQNARSSVDRSTASHVY